MWYVGLFQLCEEQAPEAFVQLAEAFVQLAEGFVQLAELRSLKNHRPPNPSGFTVSTHVTDLNTRTDSRQCLEILP
jgi:hypothetical protein